jgi:uncharacterized protein RhaS with RHS repeats
MYYRARYYSPALARFTGEDPAGFEGSGSNLYWYAYGNPLSFTDPSGECFPCVPSFNPVAPLEDGIDQVGEWVSDAPGVASDAVAYTLLNLSAAEQLQTAVSETVSYLVCRAAVGIPEPRAKLAAAGTCVIMEFGSAAQLGVDLADEP